MKDNNQENSNVRRNSANREPVRRDGRRTAGNASGQTPRPRQGTQQARQSRQSQPSRQGAAAQGRPRTAAGAQAYQTRPEGLARQPRQAGEPQRRRPQTAGSGTGKRTAPPKRGKNKSKNTRNLTPKQAARKKRNKILLFISEIFLLLILVVVFWGFQKASKIKVITIDDADVQISEEVKVQEETGAMKGYRNIALFGVDSRDKQLDKATRTDVIMIASINLDTKEVRLVSVYRDTWLNLGTDTYNKANAAYSKGGPQQALSMLNMNLDMNITDFVTVGFEGLVDVINAVGGIEIDVKENEIAHLNSYQVSMCGKPDGTLNSNGEPNYVPDPNNSLYKHYKPVEHAGLQTLNGLQATAYCRIRYVGDDFQRTVRQRTVLEKTARKAMTLNPATLNEIANAVFPEIATSLDFAEIVSLLADIGSYDIGPTAGFPFEDSVQTGRVGKASVVIPVDLEKNVIALHKFLFDEDWTPSETVKKCSRKIVSDTGVSAASQ
ncbi:MAG: LCP family protein [Roseburia sp.]|nr:LCP family protein [Roseburia sp.]